MDMRLHETEINPNLIPKIEEQLAEIDKIIINKLQ